MNYPRCKTCKYWGDCGRPADRMYMCYTPKVVDGNGLDEAEAETGYFYTGPDFGCVHHEPKESPK